MTKGQYTTWIKATIVRVVRTGAQVALGSIGATALISQVNWALVADTTVLSMTIAGLMCLAGLPEVPKPEA